MKKLITLIFFALVANGIKAQLLDFKIYPNPFINDVTIKVKSRKLFNGNYVLHIYDITGRLLIDESGLLAFGPNEMTINTDRLGRSGIYVFLLMSEGDTLIQKGVKSYTVGENELVDEAIIKSYPNPVLKELIITGLMNDSVMKIKIFNILGQLVFSSESARKEALKIDLQNLNSAIYFLTITDESDNLIYRTEFQKM